MSMNATIKGLSQGAKEMIFVLGSMAELQQKGLVRILSTNTLMTQQGRQIYKALVKRGFSMTDEQMMQMVPAILNECEIEFEIPTSYLEN